MGGWVLPAVFAVAALAWAVALFSGIAIVRLARPGTRFSTMQRIGRWDLKASPYLYIAPFFILFAVFGLFPIVYTAVIALMVARDTSAAPTCSRSCSGWKSRPVMY